MVNDIYCLTIKEVKDIIVLINGKYYNYILFS